MSGEYKRNHYVPEWYQYRFLSPDLPEKKFRYLDLKPDVIVDSKGRKHTKTALRRWGPPSCFFEDDLYTTRFGHWESTEIEQKFFGKIDNNGRKAVEYFADFQHPSADKDALYALLPYMSVQKLRTPKGLDNLAGKMKLGGNKNTVLLQMQRLQNLYCALWTECVWCIADASESETKFIISDHPVTVYNSNCFPGSKWCIGSNDPDIWLSGTHTIFPLSIDKILILTNLSWVRNSYGNPLKERPNPNPFRGAIFNFLDIQTGRKLSDIEVNEINFIIKKRAYRFIASAKEEWLYPEEKIPSEHWRKLGRGYLLFPDPRSMTFGGEVIIGYENKRADGFDEYGHKPWHPDHANKERRDKEWPSFLAFQGEYARAFGTKRRGTSYHFGKEKIEDSEDYHEYHLSLEKKYKPSWAKKRG